MPEAIQHISQLVDFIRNYTDKEETYLQGIVITFIQEESDGKKKILGQMEEDIASMLDDIGLKSVKKFALKHSISYEEALEHCIEALKSNDTSSLALESLFCDNPFIKETLIGKLENIIKNKEENLDCKNSRLHFTRDTGAYNPMMFSQARNQKISQEENRDLSLYL